jgi:selenide,water dikinase
MTTLNRASADALSTLPADALHACTDITGFGFIGHATEMAAASGVSLQMDASAVPLLDGALDLVRGNIPGGGRTNRQHFGGRVEIAPDVAADVADLLFDPQTSGGLLAAVAEHAVQPALRAFEAAGVRASVVGRVVAAVDPLIAVR